MRRPILLMTDPRLGAPAAVLAAARRVPVGGGVIVRHDGLTRGARQRLVRGVRAIARARGLTLFLAGTPSQARRAGAAGVHLRRPTPAAAARARAHRLVTSAPVHDAGEARRAARAGIAWWLISPVHPTRSHPGAGALGVRGAASLAAAKRVAQARPAIASHERRGVRPGAGSNKRTGARHGAGLPARDGAASRQVRPAVHQAARGIRGGAVALGGMTSARARALRRHGLIGWAGIDAFVR